VNRHLVLQRDDPKEATVEFGNLSPKSVTIVFLRLAAERMLDRSNAPLLLEVRSLTEYFLLEVVGEPVLRHKVRIAQIPWKLRNGIASLA
jgi:hypothetical protein